MQGSKLLMSLFGVVAVSLATIPLQTHASTFCTTTSTNIPLSECEALYDFYTATNGASWSNDNGWLASADVATWHGVTLVASGAQMHVVGIDLDNNNLAGTVPASIDDLILLEDLSLADNAIISLPNEIGNIFTLQTIDLSNNDLVTLPNTWASLDALVLADFSYNGLTSLPATFTEMAALSMVYLRNNALTSLPATLGDLDSLTILEVSYNSLSSLPATTDGLTSLVMLDVRNNVLTSLPTSLAGLTSLTTLYASNNSIASLPDSFGQLSAISLVDLQSNALTSLPSTIGGLTTLDTLYLQSNQLTTLPTEIGDLDDLETLYVQSNRLTSVPDSIGDMNVLQRLLINSNRLSSLPAAWANLDTLQWMHAYSNTGMVGTIPTSYTGLTSLTQFYIYSNALNRTTTGYAVISTGLSSWLQGVTTKHYHGQADITAPLLSGSGTISALITGAISYSLAINENSYPVSSTGVAMSITFTGGQNCTALTTATTITQNTGTMNITITPTVTGGYENCGIYTTDHAGLRSNTVTLGSFAYGDSIDDRCDHPSVTVPASECRALYSLYSGTIGANWTTKTNWLTNFDIESWYGVRTNDYNGEEHVDGLFLQRSNLPSDSHGSALFWNGNNLRGSLPSEISNLPYLKDFNVSRNTSLAGTLPSGTGWTQLQYFYAEQADIQGTIPSSWSGLTSLLVLSLPGNALTGTLPEGMNWNLLQILDLNANNFNGSLPSSWSGFTNLTTLSLHNNKFVGALPTSWSAMSALSNITLQGNNLDRTSDHLVIIPTSVQTRWNAIATKNISSQGDMTPPVVVGTGTIPWLATGTFSYSVSVQEASYMVNGFGEGISVLFSGPSICTGLIAEKITVAGQYTGVRITPSQEGAYAGCLMAVRDHGSNVSNYITLPTFAYDLTNGSICYNPQLTVSQQECVVLVDMYNSTSGNQWTNATGWLVSANVDSWYGVNTRSVSGGSMHTVTTIDLSSNNLRGTIPSSVGSLSSLTGVTLAANNLTGTIPSQLGNLASLRSLNLSQNNLRGALPSALGSLSGLLVLDLHSNSLIDELPATFNGLISLKTGDLSYNQLEGDIGVFDDLVALVSLDLSHNLFSGPVPTSLTALTALRRLYINHNALDRDVDHKAFMNGGLLTWYNALTTGNRSNQSDSTAPTIEWGGTIQDTVAGGFTIDVQVVENSYLLNAYGSGLALSFTGAGYCTQLFSTDLIGSTGWNTITIYPISEGDYNNCEMIVTDHAGNQDSTILDSFTYSISCGDGLIGDGEACDEGSFCDDGENCTGNPSLCPTECAPRLIDDCNPLCQLSACGDGYEDSDGVNDQFGDYDDEFCDEGKYCDNGTPCTNNPEVCQTGPSECTTRLINGCGELCGMASCGDGTLDPDGVDNIEENNDDEFCDDGNSSNGDGCTSLCQLEYCGDSVTDLDGVDNVADNADDEQCDLGTVANGKLGGVCDNDCQLPSGNCGFCYDLCDGGTGNNTLYLLIDVSGSMENGNRLQHAKDGATAFLDLIIARQLVNTGFVTKVGLIKFNSSATNVVTPTTNIASVQTAINALTAGGGTNFGDPLKKAREYFASNDLTYGHHVILLSDGLPTSSSNGSYDPEEWGDYQADLAKSAGIGVYTIAVDQTDEGIEYMSHLSSSTYLNRAWNKTATQETTYSPSSTYAASFAVNASKDGSEYSATANNTTTPWRQVNLGEQIAISEVRIWNRVSARSDEVSRFWLWIKPSTFTTDNITTQRNDATIYESYHTGEAGRPTYYTGFLWTGRYLRFQLANADNDDNLTISEAEVMGCPTDEPNCTDVYHYQDYEGDSIETIYKHIFGVIHCGCEQEIICTECGDGIVHPTQEECDEGSYCDDLTTSCTSNPTICTTLGLGSCEPRFSQSCTNSCTHTYCGDGVMQTPNRSNQTEACDDGNDIIGDGCTTSCALESCGDGYRDINGPDNIWLNADDEECDDGNAVDTDDCSNSCEWTNPVNPTDGACTSYGGIYNFTGTGTPNAPLSGALCDTGDSADFSYTGNQWIRYCEGLFGGDNVQCIEQEYRCGDGITEGNNGEECDDGDRVSGDGCDAFCQLEPPLAVPSAQGQWCQSGDPVAVQMDEILPLRWQLIPVENIDLNATSCNDLSAGKWIPASSVTCNMSIFNAQAGTSYNAQMFSGIDCIRTDALTDEFTDLWDDLLTSHDVVKHTVLGDLLISNLSSWHAQRKGRYRALITSTTYTFCGRDRNGDLQPQNITYMPASGPLCTIPFTVTDGYLLQKGVSLAAVTNTPVNTLYVDEGGQPLVDEGFLSEEGNAVEANYQYDYAEQIIATIMDTYRNSAIAPSSMQGTTESLQKVVNQPIYYFRGTTWNPDITIGNWMLLEDVPFTLLVENADLIVNGSLYGQGVYIVKNGTITFDNNSCDDVDVVRGIFATDEGFSTTRIRNDDADASEWCDGGGLRVEGILIGEGINDAFMKNRRATLNLWSTEQNTDLFVNYTQQQLPPGQLQEKKLEKNRRLFEGASVLIITDPDQWHKLGPGAKELFDQLLINIGE